jgi:tetratricopeptide (TPR) repeat protein
MNKGQYTTPKPSRNAPCPCGSGRKFKQCCGRAAKSLADAAGVDPAEPIRLPLSGFTSLPDEVRRQLDMVARLERQPHTVAAASHARSGADRRSAAAVFLSRAVALRRAGKIAESIDPLQRAIAVDPAAPHLHHDLGITLQQCHRHPEAASSLQRAVALKPDYAKAYYALGISLQSLGRNETAIVALRRAVELSPKLAGAHGRLGQLLYLEQRYLEARESLRRASAAAPDTTFGRVCEAGVLIAEEKFEEAAQLLRRAVARDPGNFEAVVTLAEVLSYVGDFEAAIAQYERALVLGPDAVTAWSGLVQIKQMTEADRPLVARVLAYLQQQHVSADTRMRLHFALGKAFDDLAEYEDAMRHLDAANQIRRELQPFDRTRFRRHLDGAIARYDPRFFAERSRFGVEDETPVFVLGMPRSGTTLVEQILSSHPQIAGGGELPFWRQQVAAFGEVDDPGAIDETTARRLAVEYLAVLRGFSATALRVTDKMPFNFLWIGLIRLAFPRARFIHCRRHPLDTCLSIYCTSLESIRGFAGDRDDLVFFYREYARLMDHWRAVLPPDRFLEVDYEALTADPETQSRHLVAFCSLEWNEACLFPQKNGRAVLTASKWQARQPVYRTSVERWRRYEPWLGSLRELTSLQLSAPLPG